MLLHTVNKSPLTHQTLASCLTYAIAGNSVLLIEDGVYGALENTQASGLIKNAINNGITVYVLEADVHARGLQQLINGVKKVDYAGFVNLVTQHSNTQSWF
jgi:tRNA 2-thiouridine synthesizing protein B